MNKAKFQRLNKVDRFACREETPGFPGGNGADLECFKKL